MLAATARSATTNRNVRAVGTGSLVWILARVQNRPSSGSGQFDPRRLVAIYRLPGRHIATDVADLGTLVGVDLKSDRTSATSLVGKSLPKSPLRGKNRSLTTSSLVQKE